MMSRSLFTLLTTGLVGLLAFEASAAQLKYFERVEVGETAKMPVSSGKKSAAQKNSRQHTKKTAAAKKAAAPATKKVATRKSKAADKNTDGGKRIGREFVFDGSNVNGQYHSAGEAVAKVEQEKKMNDLVGMRRDFKDRLAVERDRLKSQAAE